MTAIKALLTTHSAMKLQIELVPNSCWYSNVRSNVTPKQWDVIRKKVYSEANNHCEICGGQGTRHPVECHEIWTYDESTNVQKLDRFQALCTPCHGVKHMGLSEVRGNGTRALKWFASINKIDYRIAQEIRNAVFEQWQQRSQLKWALDISLLARYGIDPISFIVNV